MGFGSESRNQPCSLKAQECAYRHDTLSRSTSHTAHRFADAGRGVESRHTILSRTWLPPTLAPQASATDPLTLAGGCLRGMASTPEPLVLADQKAEEARKLIAQGSFDPAIELLATALELRCMPALFEPGPAHTTLLVRVLTRTPSALQYRGARRRAQRLC